MPVPPALSCAKRVAATGLWVIQPATLGSAFKLAFVLGAVVSATVPAKRMTDSPAECANRSGLFSLRDPKPVIVRTSLLAGLAPIEILSPALKPLALATGTSVAPAITAPARLVVVSPAF